MAPLGPTLETPDFRYFWMDLQQFLFSARSWLDLRYLSVVSAISCRYVTFVMLVSELTQELVKCYVADDVRNLLCVP
jgi:hypothetical protein